MTTPDRSGRLAAAYDSLSEMALGRFRYRAPALPGPPELAAFEQALEALALRGSAVAPEAPSFASPFGRYAIAVFELGVAPEPFAPEPFVRGASDGISALLGPLEGRCIGELLASSSDRDVWESALPLLGRGPSTAQLHLHFRDARGSHVPAFCLALALEGTATLLLIAAFPKRFLPQAPADSEAAVAAPLAVRVHAHILEHLREPLTAKDLCARFATSYSVLWERFHACYGMAPYQFYIEQRLLEARRLLGEEGGSLKAVAYELGFQSYGAFATAFRRAFGCSPRAYAADSRKP